MVLLQFTREAQILCTSCCDTDIRRILLHGAPFVVATVGDASKVKSNFGQKNYQSNQP